MLKCGDRAVTEVRKVNFIFRPMAPFRFAFPPRKSARSSYVTRRTHGGNDQRFSDSVKEL